MEHDKPFLADTDPAFVELREDMRISIRLAEGEFRKAIQEDLLDKVPAELAASIPSIAVDMPARFLRGLQPFFACLNDMLNAAEMLSAEARRSVQ